MIRPIVLIFLLLSGIFALVHYFAVLGSMYWYYSWFDIMMHFWGGALLVLGIYSFGTFKSIRYQPTLFVSLTVLFVVTLTWELFEWQVNLFDPETPFLEAIKDMVVGFFGGLLTHQALAKYTIRP